MPSNFNFFDKIAALFHRSGVHQHEPMAQNNHSIDRIETSGKESHNIQSAILQSMQLKHYRIKRYVDYDDMDETGEIALALDIYADESCVVNPENRNIVQISGTKTNVKNEVSDLFHNILMLNHTCRATARYLCKYGCAPFKIVTDEHRTGVIGLKELDIFNFNRIETRDGDLIAFYYTDPESQSHEIFHPWEIVHLRLTNFEKKFHPYGKSVIEGGRKAHKQLRLMENSAVIYRLCLVGDTKVSTISGLKNIQDVKKGDLVYCFTGDKGVVLTKVTDTKNNGVQPILKVSVDGSFIKCTKTHPFLTRDIKTEELRWVDAEKLDKDRHQVCFPKIEINSQDSEINFAGKDLRVPEYVTPDMAYLFGFCHNNHKISGGKFFSIKNPTQKAKRILVDVFEGTFGLYTDSLIKFKSSEFCDMIKEMSKDLCPSWVVSGSEKVKREFIKGVREGCGKDVYSESFIVDKSPDSGFFRLVKSVEDAGQAPVFDISVDNENRNFIANGMVVHNTRAPQKRKFTIPVGNMPSNQVPGFLSRIAASYKKKRFYNAQTGTYDEKYSPLNQEDDFFLPRRPDGTGPDISTLEGASNLNQIEDIEYFLKKMIAPTKIPIGRLGIGGKVNTDGESKPVSQTSSEFAKSVGHVQQAMAVGFSKVAIVHLALKGYSIDDIKSFSVYMNSSNAMEELYRIETWQTRVNIMSDFDALGWFPIEWIVSNFTNLSPDEIEEMIIKRQNQDGGNIDDISDAPGGPSGGGGGLDFDDGGGDLDFDDGGEIDDDGLGDLGSDLPDSSADAGSLDESYNIDERITALEKSSKDEKEKDKIFEMMQKVWESKNKRHSVVHSFIQSGELRGIPTKESSKESSVVIVEGAETEIETVTNANFGDSHPDSVVEEGIKNYMDSQRLLIKEEEERFAKFHKKESNSNEITEEDILDSRD